MKSNVLSTLQSLTSNYDNVAVIVFDHGVGTINYSKAIGEFHFMFEDNVGTRVGYFPPGDLQADNGVYDMDIQPLTTSRKIIFTFISTCLSANLTNPLTGENWQGMVNGRARGLPFAFTQRTVRSQGPGFNVLYHMSIDGYAAPDTGTQCYIGFLNGSASLTQRIPYNTGIEYMQWVNTFFYYALFYSMPVNQALDHAAYQHWGCYFNASPLNTGFTTVWRFWNSTHGWYESFGTGCRLAVYGNGNIYLKP